MPAELVVLTCHGEPRALGRQHGEGARQLIREHLALVRERLDGNGGDDPADVALGYADTVAAVEPDLADEIAGVAEGAGITLGEAYLLQLRAEVAAAARRTVPECTTFAVDTERTAGVGHLCGGNADLPAMYSNLMIGLRLRPTSGPPILMATPAGQVSYVGMNGAGLAVFANSIVCDGWKPGFPRYLLSRVVLRYERVDDAVGAVCGIRRAASRNLLLADKAGRRVAVETTPEVAPLVEADRGLLVHSNHFESADGRAVESAGREWMTDSQRRGARLRALLDRIPLSIGDVRAALGDREGLPYALSREPNEDGTDTTTVLSSIAKPSSGTIEFAVGPPHRTNYHEFGVEQ